MPDPTDILSEHARAIWQAGLDAVEPSALVAGAVRVGPRRIEIGELELPRKAVSSVTIVGGGKAGAGMARGLFGVLREGLGPDFPLQGWVNVPDALVQGLPDVHLHAARGRHENVPTPAAVEGTRRILAAASACGPRDLMIVVVSGGGSSLLCAPPAGLSLADKIAMARLLHGRGATIEEVNAVRKHLSDVKGGGLARQFRGGWMTGLVLSDVVGDPLDVIASGPTAADTSTFADALSVLEAFELYDDPSTPENVIRHLERGRRGDVSETLRALPPNVSNVVVGGNRDALAASEAAAAALGYHAISLGSSIEGRADELGRVLAGLARGVKRQGRPASSPACVLLGGEATVDLGDDHGLGGRNQEVALSALVELGLRDLDDVALLSCGTDGEDGPTDAAGALITRRTLEVASARGLDALDHLVRHDAHPFLDATGALLRTGLTGTNVMDLRVLLVGPPPRDTGNGLAVAG